MAKRKKKKKIAQAVNKKPSWVGEIDLSKCVNGLVYNIYQCRKCILEYKVDHARQKRRRSIHIPGYKKKQLVEVCNCIEPTPLLIKFKRCPECKAEYWGFYLRESLSCKVCGSFDLKASADKVKISYYRLNEFYKKTLENLSDSSKWDCLNRNYCLTVTFDKGSKKGIACKDCPYYQKGIL